MPGLIGFVKNKIGDFSNTLSAMRELMNYRSFYKKDPIFQDQHVCASRIHKGIEQPLTQPIGNNETELWFHGELFRDTLAGSEKSDPAFFLEMYTLRKDFSFLRDLNGVYNAVLYDKIKKRIHLITDLFGLKPLYWTNVNDFFAWSSEVKCFTEAEWFCPKINTDIIPVFLSSGLFTGNQTWFKNVELVPHATVITYDIISRITTQKRYWDFNDVQCRENYNIDSLVEEMGFLFKQAVRRCMGSKHRYGVSLSAGLDSRAILATAPDSISHLHSYTFGKKGCVDHLVAQKVSKLKNSDYHFYELNETNFFLPRLEGVWNSDGQVNLMLMHGIEILSDLRELFDIELNGFAGDAILGGSLLGRIPYEFSFLNRVRRLVRAALELSELEFHVRMPFIDRDVMLFSLAIQPLLRKRCYLYSKMLMNTVPEFYRTISWEKINLPISLPYPIIASKLFMHKLSVKCRNVFNLAPKKSSYSDYALWIRMEPVASFMRKLLLDKRNLHQEFIDHSLIEQALSEHFNGKDKSSYICLCLTFELWLRQVFNKEYRR